LIKGGEINMKKLYTVWVGGIEVNNYYLTDEESAEQLAEDYRKDGYDDVKVEKLEVKS